MKICGNTAWSVVILALLMSLSPAPRPATADEMGLKFRVIVGNFENKANHSWYRGPSPGEGMADMLITALVKTGKFRVFERSALHEILAEKNLSLSDLANPGVTAAQKLEIGDILVSASITEFGYKESKATRKVIDGIVEKLEEQVARRPWQGLLITGDVVVIKK